MIVLGSKSDYTTYKIFYYLIKNGKKGDDNMIVVRVAGVVLATQCIEEHIVWIWYTTIMRVWSYIVTQSKTNTFVKCLGDVHSHNQYTLIVQDFQMLVLGIHTLTPNFPSNHFWLMDDFFPTSTPPNSFFCNQNNYLHQANMDIYP